MQKADLHVHSRYSAVPADAVLKKYGTQESYTEVEEVYQSAKSRGMDYVTITDHNVMGGALKLVEQYPDEAFTGVEFTVLFPEDGCAIHLLVYDFTAAQFEEMSALRGDIYRMRDYIRDAQLPYSVAHASYSVNGKLTLDTVEKLLLLFDVFETINGARVVSYNDLFKRVLLTLTPEKIEELKAKHRIEPISATPWVKSFTGGSDEHAGLFIGDTYTTARSRSKAEFLQALRAKSTDSAGRSNHYKTQVYTFLKITYQYSLTRPGSRYKKAWDELCGAIFDGKRLSWKSQLIIQQLKRSRKRNTRLIASQLHNLIRQLEADPKMGHQQRIDLIYRTVASIEDEFFVSNFEELKEGFAKGDLLRLMSSSTAVFRSFFMSLPFLGTFRHLHQSSVLMDELRARFIGPRSVEEKKILWFTDTIEDLNGVSGTLQAFSDKARARGMKLKLVVARAAPGKDSGVSLDLPVVYEYVPEFYADYHLRFPSLLKSLEMIYDEYPTEIVVSTPGLVGLLGVLAARLFGIPCRGVYHSDFTRMTELSVSGGSMASLVKGYVRWFYSMMDEVLVPTRQTINLLLKAGYDEGRLRIFKRGIDDLLFFADPSRRREIKTAHGLDEKFTILYSGRVSHDKSLMFLVRVYKELRRLGREVNLVIAGDGGLLKDLKTALAGCDRVLFTGRKDIQDMPALYNMADLFVFPSTMDTFGMSVLEAQCCGLPAVVTNMGGPQEVIKDDETGWVVPADNTGAWVDAICKAMDMQRQQPAQYSAMGVAARERVKKNFSWDAAVEELYANRS